MRTYCKDDRSAERDADRRVIPGALIAPPPRPEPLHDPINPSHYKKAGGVETIDYIMAVTADLVGPEAVCVSNILRYISRYRHKGDNPMEQLDKAQWYLNRLKSIVYK